MPLRLVTPAGAEPLTLVEAKAHLRLDTADDDTYVTSLITAARMYAEQVCWRGLITQTWELVLANFQGEDVFELGSRGQRWGIPNSYMELPRGNFASSGSLEHIELPMGQLQSVTTVKYIDVNGVQQTLASTEYTVDTVNIPGRVRLDYNKQWPPTRTPQWDAVRIQYVVGYVDAASVPMPIKQAMLILLAAMYEYRSPEIDGRVSQVQFTADALLQPYRLVRIG